MKTNWLQFVEYDESNNCIITDFEVSTEWLENQIKEPLEVFLYEYTTNEAKTIYDQAVLYGKILNENTSK